MLAQVYNSSSKYQLLGISVWGNSYIVGKGVSANASFNDLKGEVLLAFQQSATPGIILLSTLKKAGLVLNTDYKIITDVSQKEAGRLISYS
jgi:ABC-type nitrate/sulfonate/bicarbonate transport system substrate-binding protein